MSRNIPNRPHPTPDPEKSHNVSRAELSGLARPVHGIPGSSGPTGDMGANDPEADDPMYDSCLDDLNLVLSQSMQEPDPDPNLGSGSDRSRSTDGAESDPFGISPTRGRAPRTSEIFRSVVASGATAAGPVPPPTTAAVREAAAGEPDVPDLGIVERRPESGETGGASVRFVDGPVPWSQVVLLSYASILTLALIWLLWGGRHPRAEGLERPVAETPVLDAPSPSRPPPEISAPPLPPENVARLGQAILLGELEVMPLSVEARSVELVRRIDAHARRRENACLVLTLRLSNRSRGQALSPVDHALVRDRDLRSFDPYIETPHGRIRLFPLAMDSEWSILGQDFPRLNPGQSAETFIAAEPGSADHLADEMTWRVRLRIGVYRSDMLGVRFTREEVRHPPQFDWDEEE